MECVCARGWAWKDVLPYFRKLETDLDFDGELHGRDGRPRSAASAATLGRRSRAPRTSSPQAGRWR
jgi:choline dehydrogenase-like flavoprotein